MKTITVGGHELEVEIAGDEKTRYEGLSEKEDLGTNEGMLFVWPMEKEHRIVMRDMNFGIDMIFADSNGNVTKVCSRSRDGEGASALSKYAIEVPRGWCNKVGVSSGDKVQVDEGEFLKSDSHSLTSKIIQQTFKNANMNIGMFAALASQTPQQEVNRVEAPYNEVVGQTPDGQTNMDKQDSSELEGVSFYSEINDEEVKIEGVEGDKVRVTSGEVEWWERMEDVRDKITDGAWEEKDDPCWDGYEMVGTKEQDGETVPDCVPKDSEKAKFLEAINNVTEDFLNSPTDGVGRTFEKEWIPYLGPRGGEGWQNSQDMDEVVYQAEAPGKAGEGYEEFVEEHNWGTEGQGDEKLDVEDYWDLEDENHTDFAHGPENAKDTSDWQANPEQDPDDFRQSKSSDLLIEGLNTGKVDGFTMLGDLTARGEEGYNPRDENTYMVGLKSENFEGEEAQEVTKDQVIDFYKEHAEIINGNTEFRIGGYKFPDKDKFSLDLVVAVNDEDEAAELGDKADQWSVANLRKVAKDGWSEGEVELGGAGEDTLETKEEIEAALEEIDSLKKSVARLLGRRVVARNQGELTMTKDEKPPKVYESTETGTKSSIYDLAIGARHAELDKEPEEGPENAIRFDGTLWVPVQTDE